MAFGIIDPKPIGRLEVVANINIRGAIAVEVAEHRCQTPVKRRLGQGLAILIQKSSVGPGERCEMAFAVIVIEDVGFAVFLVDESAALLPCDDMKNEAIG